MDLKNKVAVVTGASTGIGQAIAIAIAAKGAKVALVARNLEGLKRTEGSIKKAGGITQIFQTDLRKENEINNLVSGVLRQWGSADAVINVAGVWHDNEKVYYGVPLHETPIEQIDEVIDVTLRGTMLLSRALVSGMIEKKQGKIINISGTFSSGGAGWLHYYVAKLGVENFTVGLASELRKHQIQVNCISPSDTATDALIKYFGDDATSGLQPENIAELALFLLCDPVADNITGETIVIKNKLA